MLVRAFSVLLAGMAVVLGAAEFSLPPRPAAAPGGDAAARSLAGLGFSAREAEVLGQLASGNVPEFWRRFVEVQLTNRIDGREIRASILVSPDYLALGSDDDYFLSPLSPAAAQAVADKLDCTLPTRRMVDLIYNAAPVKLAPTPIPPSAAMTTVPVFAEHNSLVWRQRREWLGRAPLGALVAGHKKDVVLTPRLAGSPGKVAIYGWHQPDGKPIQPLYLAHAEFWVDYSHGVRFVRRQMTVDGRPTTVDKVLADPGLSALLSDEGPLPVTRYGAFAPNTNRTAPPFSLHPAAVTNRFRERETTRAFAPDVRVVVNSPAAVDSNKPTRLVLYALPNGNTIEQTIGRRTKEGDDWHFNIQHVGAQTRWLREHVAEANLVVAYLECAGLSWPAWRTKNDPDGRRTGAMVDALRREFGGPQPRLVLTGHSGGGSFTFGFLNSVTNIPDDIERIAFLDSNYAYDAARGHHTKLARWLTNSPNHFLSVLAYHDSIALLDGKTFVSEKGGTWGRSLAMLGDLGAMFPFTREADTEWQRHSALNGRVKFLLNENPARAILHTVQVERNGFIHALLTGTEFEGRSYTYFGPRVYDRWIAPP